MLCALLFSVIAWGQEPTILSGGSGISSDPYQIGADDWEEFATMINTTGGDYLTAHYKLIENVTTGSATIENNTVTVADNGTMIGTSSNKFSGTFNGDGHTLTFYYDVPEYADDCFAPFRYTDGASFTSLTICGKIDSEFGNPVAGLIGNNTNTTNVSEVIVSMILKEINGANNCGGFVSNGCGVIFNDCLFNGSFSSQGNYCGGFCGLGDVSTTLNNCLYNPYASEFWGDNFVYTTDSNFGDENLVSCYYTEGQEGGFGYESTQGVLAYTLIPDNKIGHYEITVINTRVYTDAKIELFGVENEYLYDMEETISLDIPYSVKYNNGANAISAGVCLAVILNDSDEPVTTITTTGTYRLIITGIHNNETNDGYHGTITKTFEVKKVSFGNWDDLKTLLANNSSITLTCNYRDGLGGSGTLIINRDIEIDLNGFTIDRNLSEATEEGQVIRINSGKTVSITGPGVITGAWNKAKTTTEHGEYNDGGGIYNKGTLTLNTVTIANNKCVKKETGTSSTARGGGIYSGQGSSLTMTNVIVKNNHAQGGGGGVFAEQASVSMTNCTVRSNESLDKGGGIRLKKCGTTNISSTDITYNAADNSGHNSVANGGGIHMEDGTLNLTSCNINNNNSSKFGGGMYILSGTVNATNCNINYNQCYDDDGMFNSRGGGVYIHGGSFKMNGGTITGNSSKMANGGGVFINSSGAEFHVEGAVQIKDNFKIDENGYTDPTPTNVFIAGKTNSDVIHVDGDITGAEIWVSKNGGSGSITTGLEGHGSPSQFKSDEGYIIPDGDSEAALDTPPTWTNDAALPVGVTEVTSNNYTIDKPVIVDTRLTDVTSVSFTDDGCLIIKEGGYLSTNIILDDEDSKKDRRVVVYGGEFVPTNALPATIPAIMKKDIHSATGDGKYWYIFSSAVNTPNIITKTNVITIVGYNEETGYVDNQYDLYRFNEAVVKQWENYRSTGIVHEGFSANQPASSLENGRGYLYRNENNYTLTLTGDLNLSGVNYELSYSETVAEQDNPFKGFNIIGNPYSHNIYKGAAGSAIPNGELLEAKYYVLDPEDGSWDLTNDGTAIPPMTGILVQAKAAGTLTMANSMDGYVAPSKGNDDNNNIWFAVANSKYEDKACIEFRKGHGLNKISHLNEEAPMLYVNYNGEKFASADVNPAAKVINLNFEAKTTGMFTLSCKANGNFSYLHLYDRLTGNDVDMLLEGEYSFIASPTDNENRFLVVLDPLEALETLDGTFAYQNGNDIIVNGEGNLQIFDVMGRLIATQRINGVETVNVSMTGVYIFKLNEKTQKIVVR